MVDETNDGTVDGLVAAVPTRATARRKQLAVSMDVWLELAARLSPGQTFDGVMRTLLGLPAVPHRFRARPGARENRVARADRMNMTPRTIDSWGVAGLAVGEEVLVPLRREIAPGVFQDVQTHQVRVVVSRLHRKPSTRRYVCAGKETGTLVTRVA